MRYILSDGPYTELNEKEGIESAVWFVTENDDNDNPVIEYGKFYSQESAIIFADKKAKEKKLEHVCEAGRA